MSFDKVDPYSAGYGKPRLQRPGPSPNFAGNPFTGNPADMLGMGIPIAGAVSKSFTKEWAKNSLAYGSHNLAAEAINRATGTGPMKIASTHLSDFDELGGKAAAGSVNASAAKVMTYSDLFHLGTKQTPIHKMSWERLINTIKFNVREFGPWMKPSNIGRFFAHTNGKEYLKKTVLNANFQPVKDLTHTNSNRQIGTGLVRTFVLGLMGYDVLKHTHTAYQHAKAQEDGTFKSKLHTYKETSKAFGKYSLRDGTSWEVMGVGAAIGRAILPIAICGVSAGGIIIGALAGILAERAMDKLLHTGAHDPVQPPAKPEKKKPGEKYRHDKAKDDEDDDHDFITGRVIQI
jgi:hypothetical protein